MFVLTGRKKITTMTCIHHKEMFFNFFKELMEMLNPDLNFGTMLHLLLLRNCVGDHHSLEAGVVDA